jgi:hypothetical protein
MIVRQFKVNAHRAPGKILMLLQRVRQNHFAPSRTVSRTILFRRHTIDKLLNRLERNPPAIHWTSLRCSSAAAGWLRRQNLRVPMVIRRRRRPAGLGGHSRLSPLRRGVYAGIIRPPAPSGQALAGVQKPMRPNSMRLWRVRLIADSRQTWLKSGGPEGSRVLCRAGNNYLNRLRAEAILGNRGLPFRGLILGCQQFGRIALVSESCGVIYLSRGGRAILIGP